MPHWRIDPEVAAEYADMAGESLPDDFDGDSYEPAEADIDFGRPDAPLRQLRDVLLAAGYEAVTCTYDGGYDEGFAHFEAAVGTDGEANAAAVAERLGDVGELLSNCPWIDHRLPKEARSSQAAAWAKLPGERRLPQALDILADVLCSKLVGESFGTGEAAIRGRLRWDLNTGHIVDIEENPPESNYFE